MPPVLAGCVSHEHAHLFSRHQVAARDGNLAWFGAVGGVVGDVASVTPDPHAFISGISAGVLPAATKALHVGAGQVDAPIGGEQTVPGLHEEPAVNKGEGSLRMRGD